MGYLTPHVHFHVAEDGHTSLTPEDGHTLNKPRSEGFCSKRGKHLLDRYCYMQDGTIIGEYFPATLYQFIFSPIIPANYSLIANNLNMHSRLGHPSGRVMRELGYSPSSEFKICEHCSAGKMTKVLPKSSTFKAIHPLVEMVNVLNVSIL